MTVSANDVLRVAMHLITPEQVDAYNVIGLFCTAGTCTDAQLLAAVGCWLSTAYVFMQSHINDQVDLAEGRVAKMVWSGTEWITNEIIGTVLPNFTATNVDDMLPHAVSPYVTFDTLAPTRKGKVKLVGFAEDQQADSILTAQASTAIANFANALRTPIVAGAATLIYAILGDDGVARATTAATVRGIVGSQRQRKPGVGI